MELKSEAGVKGGKADWVYLAVILNHFLSLQKGSDALKNRKDEEETAFS